MEQADLIWMNGEFVAWEDAKVHVLTHGLHYGTGVFEGIRCYETERGPAIFRHPDHLDRLFQLGRALLHADPVHARAAARGDARADRAATASARATSARSSSAATGTMGLYPLDAPVDVSIAVWEWGAYLGEEGKRNGVRAKVSSLAADQRRLADPARQGLGPVPQLVLAKIESPQGRLRGGDPARRPRPRLRGHGREHLRRPRRRRSPRRRRPPRSSTASTASRCIQIAARPRLRGRRARHRARRALPRRRGLHDRHRGRARARCARSTTTRSAPASPGEITRAVQAAFEDALHGRAERYREWLDLVRSRRRMTRRRRSSVARTRRDRPLTHSRSDPALRRHPARRHAGRGHVALRRGEAARRAPPRRARRRPDRGRLPGLEPEGARALRAARAASASSTPQIAAFGMTRRRGVAAADDDGPARARRVASRRSARSSARPGALHLEKVVRSTARRTCAMIAESIAFLVARGQARRSTTPSTSSTATATTPPTRSRACARPPEAGAETRRAVRHQRRVAAAADRRRRSRAVRRRARRPASRVGIHCHNDAECGVANSLAAVAAGATPGAGHDERLRRALRQREPRLDHRQPAAQDGPRRA